MAGRWRRAGSRLRRVVRAITATASARVQSARRHRRVARAIRAAPASLPAVTHAAPPSEGRAQLEALLLENIVPFWYPRVIDPGGGYRLEHGADGNWLGPGPKRAIAQARQAWFFARLARSPYGTVEHLDASRHGVEFLWERQRDPEHGGFFWEVDLPAGEPMPRHKSVLAQAYVLYALSEFALASRSDEAAARATEVFRLIEAKARDRRHGGFHEFLARDWAAPEPGIRSYHDDNDPTHKTFGTQVHLLEALVPYVQATDDSLGRTCLEELLKFVEERMILRPIMVGSTVHRANGAPILGHPQTAAQYGHDVELVWLALGARALLGRPVDPLPDHFRGLFANALVRGEDPAGGLHTFGAIGGPARRGRRVWWAQAEAMVSALTLERLTGEPSYAAAFHRLLRWIVDHQVDRTVGDWHTYVHHDGTTSGDKAGPWRTAYHNGRAVLECLALLDDVDQGAPPARR